MRLVRKNKDSGSGGGGPVTEKGNGDKTSDNKNNKISSKDLKEKTEEIDKSKNTREKEQTKEENRVDKKEKSESRSIQGKWSGEEPLEPMEDSTGENESNSHTGFDDVLEEKKDDNKTTDSKKLETDVDDYLEKGEKKDNAEEVKEPNDISKIGEGIWTTLNTTVHLSVSFIIFVTLWAAGAVKLGPPDFTQKIQKKPVIEEVGKQKQTKKEWSNLTELAAFCNMTDKQMAWMTKTKERLLHGELFKGKLTEQDVIHYLRKSGILVTSGVSIQTAEESLFNQRAAAKTGQEKEEIDKQIQVLRAFKKECGSPDEVWAWHGKYDSPPGLVQVK